MTHSFIYLVGPLRVADSWEPRSQDPQFFWNSLPFMIGKKLWQNFSIYALLPKVFCQIFFFQYYVYHFFLYFYWLLSCVIKFRGILLSAFLTPTAVCSGYMFPLFKVDFAPYLVQKCPMFAPYFMQKCALFFPLYLPPMEMWTVLFSDLWGRHFLSK